MYEKNSEKIQSVGHIFRLRVYYRVVKNKKIFKLQYFFFWQNSSYNARIYVLYFTGSFFRHNVYYKVNL